MASSIKLIFATALLNICLVSCLGSAIIKNSCDYNVYVWSVANLPNLTANWLIPFTGQYSETFRENPDGGGISLKIATALEDEDTFITQFEYTYHSNNPYVYYDISNINGYPFKDWGLYLSPSLEGCSDITCDPGELFCLEAYNYPSEDSANMHCDVSADLTLTLCPPQSTFSETVTIPVMTTDYSGDVTLATLTTIFTSVGPAITFQGIQPESITTNTDISPTTVATANLDPATTEAVSPLTTTTLSRVSA